VKTLVAIVNVWVNKLWVTFFEGYHYRINSALFTLNVQMSRARDINNKLLEEGPEVVFFSTLFIWS